MLYVRCVSFTAVFVLVSACSGRGGADASTSATGTQGGSTGGGTDATGATGTTGTSGTSGPTGGASSGGDTGGGTPPTSCERPFPEIDTSVPDRVVGDGTAESCTAAALQQAIDQGGVIAFDCGPDPVTIPVTDTLVLPIDRNVTLDGGGKITLDGGDAVRILSFESPNFRATTTRVALLHMTLRRGRAPATDFTPDPGNGCAWGYKDGAGGAVFVRDGVLYVEDVTFEDNHAASPGPDVGGGAIYVLGSLDVRVYASRFVGNSGSNGGAIGSLQSTLVVVDSVFESNAATGTGANYVEPGCPDFNHPEQGGAGGNGGAVAVDGVEPTPLVFCGTHFVDNTAGAFGGAVFRTPNGDRQDTEFHACRIQGNRAESGGGGLYISNSNFVLDRCLVAENATPGLGGGVRAELASVLDFTNTTFFGNASEMGLAGALSYDDAGGGSIVNCTFARNRAEGGPGLFTAAIRGTTAEIRNTIFYENTTADPYNPMQCWFDPHPGSNDVQWPRLRKDSDIEDTPCVEGIVWLDAMVRPLEDLGGPTQAAVPADLPELRTGVDCPPMDQLGRPRPPDGCTLGAVELP